MLRHPTLDKLTELKLGGMALALREQLATPGLFALGFEERLGLLVDREITERDSRLMIRRLQLARFRTAGCLEDLDYRPGQGLDRAFIARLATGEWSRAHYGLLITGPTGVGKTYTACAFGQAACRQGLSVLYQRLPLLLRELSLARGDGRYARVWKGLVRPDLIILDDWGLARLNDESRRDLLELLDARYERRATLNASQFPVETWHEQIGDATLADAIVDRLIHSAYRLALSGESMRKVQAKKQREAEM